MVSRSGAADRPDDLASRVIARAETAYTISERALARLHPGIAAPALLSVVRLPRWSPTEVLRPSARLLLVADGIEYAGNLGTLIRSADACGADGVVLTSVDARLSHPKVFVASRGTVMTMPVLEYGDVDVAPRDLAAAGFTAYVADPAAERSYRATDYAERAAIVVGRRATGSVPRGGLPTWRGCRSRCSVRPTRSTSQRRQPSCCSRRGRVSAEAGQLTTRALCTRITAFGQCDCDPAQSLFFSSALTRRFHRIFTAVYCRA